MENIPFSSHDDRGSEQEDRLLTSSHKEAAPSWSAHDAMRQRIAELENRLLERNQKLEEYTRYLDIGGRLNIQLPRLNKVSAVLQFFAEQIQAATNSRFSAIYRVDNDWIEYAAGVKAPALHHRRECLEKDGAIGQILEADDIQFLPQLDEKEVQRFWRDKPREYNISSLLIAPVVCADAFRGILYLGYDRPARFDKKDEIMLRASIEATVDTLHRIYVTQLLERYIQAREQEISVLHDLSTYSSELIELDDLLQKSLRRVIAATQCDTGLIYWPNEHGAQENMVTCWPNTGIPEPVRLFLYENRKQKWSGQNERYSLQDLPPDYSFACLTVPVHNKGRQGCFMHLFGEPSILRRDEVIHLTLSAARQIGLSIDSTLDRKLAEEAVILEERQRMARNLHDSITQSLYALSLSGDVAVKALDRQDNDRLRTALKDITSSSLQALKEMRLMLFELRPTALEKAGLIEALELRLNTVERRSGMEAHLEYTDTNQIPEVLEVELYRIINEALNNSLRHSGARCVWVRIRPAAHMISIEVEDNGKGFEVKASKQGGMGLVSMNERALKLGGNLTVTSSAGKGTRIIFKVRF